MPDLGVMRAAIAQPSGTGSLPAVVVLHGTHGFAQFGFAREFEMGLRANKKPVETAYCEGCGHNTFFTNSTQRDNEMKRMIEFFHHHLG